MIFTSNYGLRSNYAILCLLFCQNYSQIGLNDSLVIQCEFDFDGNLLFKICGNPFIRGRTIIVLTSIFTFNLKLFFRNVFNVLFG